MNAVGDNISPSTVFITFKNFSVSVKHPSAVPTEIASTGIVIAS